MAVPKKRVSISRRSKRKAHMHIDLPNLIYCTSCGELRRPHCVCGNCGVYKGMRITKMAKKSSYLRAQK